VFAISGLHIALIAGLLVTLLRAARVPRVVCGLVVVPVVWAYTGMTGWQASAVRSAVMSTVVVGGWALNRPGDLLNSLFAAGWLILLWDPQQLFQASFQLSFSVVLSLALFAPVLAELRERAIGLDPLLPAQLETAWRRWRRALAYRGSAGLLTSLAAWLGSVPLVAYYFHLFTPGSLVANVVVVPLSGAALACNLGSLAVGAFLPGVAELFNHAAWCFMVWMDGLSQWTAGLAWGAFHMRPPGAAALSVYYGALGLVMAGWSLDRARWRRWTGSAAGLMLAGTLAPWGLQAGEWRLTILPASGGHAVFLDAPLLAGDWLVDCGNASAAEFITGPFLQSQGVNGLDNLVLTHGDVRQVGGTGLILARFKPRTGYCSGVRFRSGAYRLAREQLQARAGRLKVLQAGDRAGPWTVLHPGPDHDGSAADNHALVLHGVIEGVQVLLLSDLSVTGQNRLLKRYPDLRADIVVTGLPSQGEAVHDELLRRLQPGLVIVADAEYPATRRAGRALQDRLRNRGYRVLYVRETGAITVGFGAGRWKAVATVKGMTEDGGRPGKS
jgi:competence protein ComEC